MKLTIDDVGAHGDGIAHRDKQALFVPFALQGEVVEASGQPPKLVLEKVVTPSSERINPPCPHFGVCGG